MRTSQLCSLSCNLYRKTDRQTQSQVAIWTQLLLTEQCTDLKWHYAPTILHHLGIYQPIIKDRGYSDWMTKEKTWEVREVLFTFYSCSAQVHFQHICSLCFLDPPTKMLNLETHMPSNRPASCLLDLKAYVLKITYENKWEGKTRCGFFFSKGKFPSVQGALVPQLTIWFHGNHSPKWHCQKQARPQRGQSC